MNSTLVIARREFLSYWLSPIAYVVLIIFLGLNTFFFLNRNFFALGVADLSSMFFLWVYLFIFIVPAVSMRLWAEERKQGTLELLLTYPARLGALVLGKYVAALAFMVIGILLTIPIVMTVSALGDLDLGPVVGSYIGSILLISAYLSLGLFLSSLTENQIVAFLVTLVGLLLLNLTRFIQVSENLPRPVIAVLEWIGLGDHFIALSRGVVSSQDVIYFAVFTALFLWLNTVVLEAKKWRG